MGRLLSDCRCNICVAKRTWVWGSRMTRADVMVPNLPNVVLSQSSDSDSSRFLM